MSIFRKKAKIFKALADPVRLNILELLRDGEKCVCEITPQIGLPQPIVSKHLKLLKNCGILKDRHVGNKRLYSVTDQAIFNVIDAIDENLLNSLMKHVIEAI
ncbi:MAG: metalloregulator ArsR/SmtB family transcription factor [Candidatus Methanomethyliaceae archaeon]|nr:metalloregulator ArsR/SmtB family transcription factor [Candidatus Methanomethyliaceae archaeon]MDW7970270.1 metalloregulator ArsR/SmtB family transcription factor [Nitrososphaerota archaeon]